LDFSGWDGVIWDVVVVVVVAVADGEWCCISVISFGVSFLWFGMVVLSGKRMHSHKQLQPS
jgi:hypothetical protein